MKKLIINTANGVLEVTLAKKEKGSGVLYGARNGKLFVVTPEGEKSFPLTDIESWQEEVTTRPLTGGGPNRFQREANDANTHLNTIMAEAGISLVTAARIASAYQAAEAAEKRLAKETAKKEAKKAKVPTPTPAIIVSKTKTGKAKAKAASKK